MTSPGPRVHSLIDSNFTCLAALANKSGCYNYKSRVPRLSIEGHIFLTTSLIDEGLYCLSGCPQRCPPSPILQQTLALEQSESDPEENATLGSISRDQIFDFEELDRVERGVIPKKLCRRGQCHWG
ncbi:hypothetical protein GGX14DRAFT_384814 [Mycena pura]|uniref:Uncharacterized protein n=1 Tax=Mycena pura TaxID=153505 RepID=A0AAD6YS84_9AGAR|nr:hypothetical protein GGX14DRAFT_384814 [Mycena pura]